VRLFWRGESGVRAVLAARIAGSAELFNHRFRRTWASVNYLASHDGFTLADVVSYEHKHNEANGENNADGHNENFSANWGAEGPTADEAIAATRARVTRSMLASLFTSLGTPMLTAGDEFGRSQSGNNNAYCQDNELSWLDWQAADSKEGRALTAFTARLIALRRQHPMLRDTRFLHGEMDVLPGVKDVGWFDERGEPLTSDAWHDPEARALTLRRAGPDSDGETEVLLLMHNGSHVDLTFAPPTPPLEWNVLADSTNPDVPAHRLDGNTLRVGAHGFVLLVARAPRARSTTPALDAGDPDRP
jgi:glycogen operon protein